MNSVRAFAGSTLGRKAVMAITGLILVGFVIGHLLGNLLVFRGPEAMNSYAAMLKGNAVLLWGVRSVVFLAAVAHVWAATSLTLAQRAARPVGYAKRDPQVTTFAARTIRIGGVMLLVFIILHLLHFTTGTLRPAPFSREDVFANMIGSFQIWWVALLYVVAMVALGLHVYHGAWSSVRTLGASRPSATPLHRRVALVLAGALWLGFTSIPVAVFVLTNFR
jgi:succinate dehydrogenase / fumarate reductase, cytochrome b subunit